VYGSIRHSEFYNARMRSNYCVPPARFIFEV
jgi:hypothetical protein